MHNPTLPARHRRPLFEGRGGGVRGETKGDYGRPHVYEWTLNRSFPRTLQMAASQPDGSARTIVTRADAGHSPTCAFTPLTPASGLSPLLHSIRQHGADGAVELTPVQAGADPLNALGTEACEDTISVDKSCRLVSHGREGTLDWHQTAADFLGFASLGRERN